MLRAVVDTNVVVSGLIRPRGNPGVVVRALRDKRFVPVVSPAMLEELAATLARPWLQDKYDIDADDAGVFLRLLVLRSDMVEPTSSIRRCRDPRDDIFLEAAVDGHADCLVTGDQDLLIMHSVEEVRIISPADFIAELD